MDRRSWWTAAHEITESDTTELLTLSLAIRESKTKATRWDSSLIRLTKRYLKKKKKQQKNKLDNTNYKDMG